jgi:hypothetical protein
MIETAVHLDVAGKRRVEGLPPRRDPVNDGALETFRVIRSCAGSALLYLGQPLADEFNFTGEYNTDEISNHPNLFLGASHEAFFKAGYRIENSTKYAMLPPFPDVHVENVSHSSNT